MKPKTAHQIVKAITALGPTITVPHNVWTFLGDNAKHLEIHGTDVTLGCDFKSVEDAREATAWLVHQLGGTVTWQP